MQNTLLLLNKKKVFMSFNFNPTNFQKSEINPPATHFYPWQLAQTNSFLYIPLSVTHQIQQPLRPLTLPAYPPFKATQQPASPPMQFVPLFPLPAPNFLNILGNHLQNFNSKSGFSPKKINNVVLFYA